MDMDEAVTRLSALSTPSRLKTLILLAEQGDEGMPAGELAKQLGVSVSNISHQLLQLSNARLARSHRKGRLAVYKADMEALQELVSYLVDRCGAGHISAIIKMSTNGKRSA